MPGGVSSARLISMSRRGYIRIFRKVVGVHSFPKIFENFLTPTKKRFNPDFLYAAVFGLARAFVWSAFWRFLPNA